MNPKGAVLDVRTIGAAEADVKSEGEFQVIGDASVSSDAGEVINVSTYGDGSVWPSGQEFWSLFEIRRRNGNKRKAISPSPNATGIEPCVHIREKGLQRRRSQCERHRTLLPDLWQYF